MASPTILLYQVLIEEYESQGLQPPFPKEEAEARRAVYAAELAPLAAKLDAEEIERKLDGAMVKDFYTWLHQNGVRRSALCLSGGGIRSATFGLGLVQGIAGHGLLAQLDYLSSVSGGGYLGSWLTGWIHRERVKLGNSQVALREVEARLRELPESPLEPEPDPVRYLRSYSRFLSPKFGLLSADTWTLVATFLRNLMLNWFVLLPLLAAFLMIPRVSVILVRLGSRPWFQQQEGWILPAVFGLAVAFGAVAIAYISVNRSGLETDITFPGHLRNQKWFLVLCLLPLYLMSLLASLYWVWVRMEPVRLVFYTTPSLYWVQTSDRLEDLRFVLFGFALTPVWGLVLFGVLLHLSGFLLARLWMRRAAPGELAVVVLTGALGGASAWLAARYLFPAVKTPLDAELYVCFAAPLLLFLFLFSATLFTGLSSYYTNDADREWLARSGAWVLIAIAARCFLSGLVIFGPFLLQQFWAEAASLGGMSGLATLVLGRSTKTRATDTSAEPKQSPRALNLVLGVAAPLFAVFILIVISLGATLLIRWMTDSFVKGHSWHLEPRRTDSFSRLTHYVYHSPWWAVLAVLAGLVVVGWCMGWFVDINRFSLHAAYRNRLIRAYLGASRGEERQPNPFTGFDEADNIEMAELRGNRPFHVLSMALNLVAGKKLAWQDRKAESFTASPLHAGSHGLGYRDTAQYALHRNGKSPLSLGTALAVSGAAASPNMGYHSSPIVTFLMALFNVRLGWWLGNPGKAGDATFNTPGPRFSPLSLFAEALGLTDSEHPYVYLSDGGHFENLGLYEMVLRRCHFIIVSDATGDADFQYQDLGNAVAKIRIDLGVPIRFERILMRPRKMAQEAYDVGRDRAAAQPYCAIGRICYSCVDGLAGGEVQDGLLLYIKPSLNGTEPADIFNYAKVHSAFPHESTAEQLYSESQFESYRELGAHIMRSLLAGLSADASLEEFFLKIESELGSPPPCN
jgi:hypothetical protein